MRRRTEKERGNENASTCPTYTYRARAFESSILGWGNDPGTRSWGCYMHSFATDVWSSESVVQTFGTIAASHVNDD